MTSERESPHKRKGNKTDVTKRMFKILLLVNFHNLPTNGNFYCISRHFAIFIEIIFLRNYYLCIRIEFGIHLETFNTTLYKTHINNNPMKNGGEFMHNTV